MYELEHHKMQLERRHPSGAEEWFCPTCGRRFLIQWPPMYSMVVLEPGDEDARHSGSSHNDSGLRIGPPQVMQVEEHALPEELRPSVNELSGADPVEFEETPLTDELRPWLKWLKDAGLADEHDEAA
jgi:hypothetical protein